MRADEGQSKAVKGELVRRGAKVINGVGRNEKDDARLQHHVLLYTK